jgi:hypothetical protein
VFRDISGEWAKGGVKVREKSPNAGGMLAPVPYTSVESGELVVEEQQRQYRPWTMLDLLQFIPGNAP